MSAKTPHPGPTAPPLDPLLTVADVAEVLNVSTRTVRRLIKSRRLAHVTVGRLIRVRLDDLSAFTQPR